VSKVLKTPAVVAAAQNDFVTISPSVPTLTPFLLLLLLFLLSPAFACPATIPPPPPKDYLYVRGFTTFAGSVLASAPDSHLEVLLSGIGALTDELNWFRQKAQQRGLQLENTGEGSGLEGLY